MTRSQIFVGDALETLRTIEAESFQSCVTSPPYYGLRDYKMSGQLGLEKTPELYVARLVEVFREVRRTLRKDGTLWLNISDSFCGAPRGSLNGQDKSGLTSVLTQLQSPTGIDKRGRTGKNAKSGQEHGDVRETPHPMRRLEGIKPKDLIGIPWMLAFALRADGWYLRCPIIWAKPNGMPSSQKDRPTLNYEFVFLLSKSSRYYYDHMAVRNPLAPSSRARLAQNIDAQEGSRRANGETRTNRPMKPVVFGGSKYTEKNRDAGSENAGNLGDFRNRGRLKSELRHERDGGGATDCAGFTRERERERDFTADRTYSGKEWRGL